MLNPNKPYSTHSNKMVGLIYRSRYFRVIATGLVFLINITTSFAGCAETTIGVENKYIIPDNSFTASSYHDSRYKPYYGRLGSSPGWAPSNNNPNQYLQIDLGLSYVICAVATQGNSGGSEWVTQYKISLSMDDITWTSYQENGTLKLFAGNKDGSSTIKKHPLTQPLARYIRFIPTTYRGHKTMRVGIYGYLKACENFPLGMESGAIQDGNITASSAQHPAKNARLHYTSGSSWCASTSDSDPYLQIDLGSSHLICAVATQGNKMANQWINTYQINTSTDGTTWTTYQENNTDRIFYANFNRTTVVQRILYNGIVTRYLRIVPKTSHTGTPCLRTEIYGYPIQIACSSHSVGIPSTAMVPDHRFTATSVHTRDYYSAHKGRLGASTAWLPKTNTADDYLQVDLGAVVYICAVATQGSGNGYGNYVKKYKVSYSTNNNTWTTYSHSGVEEFIGNTDTSTVVTNTIANPFRAKFVRVIPTDYNNYKTLRVDFKGLPLGCTLSLGLENSQIPDSHITSSFFWTHNGVNYTASRGRLYGSSSWCSPTTNPTEHIQVDLGKVKTVTGIATQGSPPVNAWVTSYKVSYSFDNTYWNDYKEEQVVKNLEGNTNRNGVKVNWLRHPIAARYVRITPQTHNSGGRYCLRFDLYGCDVFAVPKVTLDTADLVLPSVKRSSRTLTCSVVGEPAPNIQWFNNGTKINGATQSTLQVQFISAEDVVSKYNCTRQDPNTRAVVCDTFYTCRATYRNYVPSGGMDEALAKVTVNLKPGKPTDVQAESQTTTSVKLKWKKPALPIPFVVKEYMIEVKGSKSYWPQYSFSKTYTQNGGQTNMVIDGLVPGTSYEFWVTASAACGKSEKSVSSKRETDIDKPVKPQGNPVTLKGKFNVSLWSVDPINGPISSYQVIVIKGNNNASNLPTNIGDYEDGKDPYVTAELKPNELKSSFSVGDNKIYGQYKNVPLDKGQTYTIAERAITNHQGKMYVGQAAVVATIEVTQVNSNSTIWALEGDEVTLGCHTSGDEPVKYTWTKTGSLALDSFHAKARGSDLIISLKNEKDFGTYVCTATNSERTVVYRINRVELKKQTPCKPKTSESKGNEVVPYVIPLILIIIGLIICIVYLVYRLRRKEKHHNEKITKSKTNKSGIRNDAMDSDYAGDAIENSGKAGTAKADELETPGYMELQPRQSSDTTYQSIQEPANRPRTSATPHPQDMSGHEQYMDLKPRVNTEYETLHHKKNAPGQEYEVVGQGFSSNILSIDTEA